MTGGGNFISSVGGVQGVTIDARSGAFRGVYMQAGDTIIDVNGYANFKKLDINGSTRIDASGNVLSANGESHAITIPKLTSGGSNGSITSARATSVSHSFKL